MVLQKQTCWLSFGTKRVQDTDGIRLPRNGRLNAVHMYLTNMPVGLNEGSELGDMYSLRVMSPNSYIDWRTTNPRYLASGGYILMADKSKESYDRSFFKEGYQEAISLMKRCVSKDGFYAS